MTDGANSPRNGVYENFSNEQMKQVRIEEQLNASIVGDYATQICLGYPSSSLYKQDRTEIINNIIEIILATQPENIYVHNLADKHKTHVASAIIVLEAIKKLPKNKQPKKVYGMEVWRGLDWLSDKDKVCFDTSKHPNLANAILGVFDSQISGGKRYDNAAIGRRLANATFFESHSVDSSSSLSYGIDLTPIITENIDYLDFINNHIDSFKKDVNDLINSLSNN
jgi:LmbE family N-acetylglucosaminyl deacetylase